MCVCVGNTPYIILYWLYRAVKTAVQRADGFQETTTGIQNSAAINVNGIANESVL